MKLPARSVERSSTVRATAPGWRRASTRIPTAMSSKGRPQRRGSPSPRSASKRFLTQAFRGVVRGATSTATSVLPIRVWRSYPAPVSRGPLLSPVKADDGSVRSKKDKPSKALWYVDATRDETRLPRQLVLVFAQPLRLKEGESLRLTLTQASEYNGQGIGRFRISVATMLAPEQIGRAHV